MRFVKRILLLLAGYLAAVPLSHAQEGYAVHRIRMTGNETFGTSVLLKHISLKEHSFYKERIKKQAPTYYSADFVQADLDQLQRFYQREGFLNARIGIDSLVVNDQKHRLDLWLRIEEGPRVMLGEERLHFNGTPEGAPPSGWRDPMKQRKASSAAPFRDEAVENRLEQLVQSMIDRGYLYSTGRYDIDLHPSDTVADVTYVLTPDSLVRVSRIDVVGHRGIRPSIILKQSALAPGDAFTARSLDRTRTYLNDLQLFKVVSVTPAINTTGRSSRLPLTLRVEEAPRLSGKVGVGYGSDESFRAFADVTYRGLFGGPTRLNLHLKHSGLDPYYVDLRWINPRFFSRQTALTVNPFLRRQTEPGFDTRSLGLNVPTHIQFNRYLEASIGYYYVRVTEYGAEGDAITPDPESPNLLYDKSGLTATFTHRTARPLLSPKSGHQLTVGAKVNGYLFGSAHDFTRLWLDARRYVACNELVLSLRGMCGLLSTNHADGYVPVEERFYSGGSTSNRGWQRSMLGPPRESGRPAGGKSQLEFNLEVRHPLFWLLEGAVFVDAANVWTESLHLPPGELAYAAGLGLRLNTPIGPVRLDVARPLWHETKRWQVFINIGQAF